MNIFTPAFYSIANVPTDTPEELLGTLRAEFMLRFKPAESYFDLGFNAIAFVNKHPDVSELLIEIQALTDDERNQGIEIATEIASSAANLTLTWLDVTKEALEQRSRVEPTGA